MSDSGDATQISAFILMPLSAVHLEQYWDNSYDRNGCAAVNPSSLCKPLSGILGKPRPSCTRVLHTSSPLENCRAKDQY